MTDVLDDLAAEYREELEPDGWTVTTERNQPTPDRSVPYYHLIFDHVLSGRRQVSFPADRGTDDIRRKVGAALGSELELLRQAPPMRNPARIAFLRTHFSGFGWDKTTRTQAAMLMAGIRSITKAEAEWLVLAGEPIGTGKID